MKDQILWETYFDDDDVEYCPECDEILYFDDFCDWCFWTREM
jgi:hypothetical protein